MEESLNQRVAAVASLDEPTRRRLYEYVVSQPGPVSRDEATEALRLPRATTAFHLDRLVKEGLLDAVYERRTGRSGPGAGRPAKLYRRSEREVAVSLPERQYEVVGRLLAGAIQDSERSTDSPRAILERRAYQLGNDLGRAARSEHPERGAVDLVLRVLDELGFEARGGETSILLANCPFHRLATEYRDLVCGMNLRLLEGLLTGIDRTGLCARLDPAPDRCCVRFETSGERARG